MVWTKVLQVIVLVWSMSPIYTLPGSSRTSDSKATDQKMTPKPFDFNVKVVEKPIVSNKKKCCRIGRSAARQGYSCRINRNIALMRINMPHRYRMKFTVHGIKWGFSFARTMEFCAKSHKMKRKFAHCCYKEARVMDAVKLSE